MSEKNTERRLAAIMVIDVVGYSRMMEADESGTVARITELRESIIEPVLQFHAGRIVKLLGDGMLIEFGSAVEAVRAAVEIQRLLISESNEERERLLLRIGINLGDLIGQDEDIYGDCVNIAARLEALAEPGGVCLSGKVLEEVRGKIELAVDDLGDVKLKNIAKPVRVYRIRGAITPVAQTQASNNEKPSIAVLCFDNMSGDPTQEYFSDGIAEHIINDLARFRDLSVIARNSSFAYKGKSPNIQQVGGELGARFILEGSVQRSGSKVRIAARLIDSESGRQIWAERYDRDVEDIFAVQDEVTETIVGTLASAYGGRLHKAVRQRKEAGRSFAAFDQFLRGLHSFDTFTREGVANARDHFEEAIRIEPGYAKALAKLAWSYLLEINYGWRLPDELSWQKALGYAREAISADDEEAWGHWGLAGYYLYQHQHDLSLAEFERAISLNPNDADVLTDFAYCLSFSGRAEEAIATAQHAMHINPHYPEWYSGQLGCMYFDARRYEEAITTLENLHFIDTAAMQIYLAASCAAVGRMTHAHEVVARILDDNPEATVEGCTSPVATPYKNSNDLAHLRDNLISAGLPHETVNGCRPPAAPA